MADDMALKARYAVYFVPEPGTALTRLGAPLLGRDSETGQPLPQPSLPGFPPPELRALTAEARRYGLHATLKAPFFLQPGVNERDLLLFVDDFVAGRSPIVLPRLMLQRIGSCFALTPSDETPQAREAIRRLNVLAAEAVSLFEPFRAELTAQEIARRQPQALTARQRSLLAEWGYPYVFEEYRFHLTLTDRLRDKAAARLMQHNLQAYLASVCDEALTVSSICICRQVVHDRASGLGAHASNDAAFTPLKRFYFRPARQASFHVNCDPSRTAPLSADITSLA
jgi:hypothetical protein